MYYGGTQTPIVNIPRIESPARTFFVRSRIVTRPRGVGDLVFLHDVIFEIVAQLRARRYLRTTATS